MGSVDIKLRLTADYADEHGLTRTKAKNKMKSFVRYCPVLVRVKPLRFGNSAVPSPCS